MALAPPRPVTPGDPAVATAANRVGTGTRAPGAPKIEGSAASLIVSPRHEWRPAEDHGYGNESLGSRQQQPQGRSEFTPLLYRFSAGYLANEPGLGEEAAPLARMMFADMLRGVRVYESNLRLLVAKDAAGPAQRGSRVNRLF